MKRNPEGQMPLKYLLAGTAIVASLAMSATAEAQPAANPTTNMPATNATQSSQDFANKAAITGMYEVQAAQIARQRSHNAVIDGFAARMIRDHGKNNAELKATAARVGLQLPTSLDAEHTGLIAQLRSANPDQFNTTYAQQQVQGHQDAVAMFTSYSQTGDNPQLMQFARTSLPVLQRHLQLAQSLSTGPQMAGSK
jgi:putative membrane protein